MAVAELVPDIDGARRDRGSVWPGPGWGLGGARSHRPGRSPRRSALRRRAALRATHYTVGSGHRRRSALRDTGRTPVDPHQVIAAALTGQVRRVIVDTAGRVLDLGRRRRLFTGAARQAVRLTDRHCTWPGCPIPAARTHTDHTIPWATGHGLTNTDNGAPLCSRHNLHKTHGYHTWRDPTGQWHHHRPDSTEITPRGQPP